MIGGVKTLRRKFRIAELVNYGTEQKPSYTVSVEIGIHVGESPDSMHRIFVETGLISRDTVPFEVVNFRGSVSGDAPFYAAEILYEGALIEYSVHPRHAGGIRELRYEPVVTPEDMRLIHPAEFHRHGIEVLSWELHNYRPHLMLFISSKKYEHFDLSVRREEESTSINMKIGESDLRRKTAPCRWLLQRISVFDIDVEEELMKLLCDE